MRSAMKLPFAILCAVPFIMVLGNSMLVPLLPLMRSALNVSLVQISLLITAFSLPAGLVIPFAGFLSDAYGRKPIMAPALILYGLGGLLAGLAAWLATSPYYLILGSRILQGIGAGGTYQLAMALTGDIFQSKERTKALGLLEAANGLGKVVSPIAGALIGLISWFAPFFVYGILAIPAGLAVWFIVKEPEQKTGGITFKTYFHNLGQILQNRGLSLLACILAGMVVLFILFGVLSYISDVLETDYDVRGLRTGLIIAVPVAAMALTSYLSGNYLQQMAGGSLKPAIVAGLLVDAGALAVMGFINNIYVFFPAMVAMGIGTGVVLPSVNTLITSISSKERGGITCLYGSMRFLGVALGPPVFGLALTWRMPLFLGAALLVGVIAVLASFYIHAEKMLPPQLLPSH
ncbi:MFS transporter [Neomoorella humiferrea]|uniref:Bacillibactin exporter n=1 Tax=Neomoorella humiferrea TaxID=676965 RepID=A0A2T0AU22_9FIRM|nr:MFS transporter [Moorella humiferrea]PRR73916.1 Bacillibactin exporter [Moorella humiferrea]